MVVVCVIRPENDAESSVVGSWWDTIRNSASHRLKVCELRGPEVSRASVESQVPTAGGVLFFGHGTRRALHGQVDLIDARNVALMNGALIIAVACHSAAELGPAAIAAGASGYLGFNDEVAWVDSLSDMFGEAAVAGAREMLSGGTLREAVIAVREGFDKILRFLDGPEGYLDPDRPIGLLFAQWNMDCVEGIGDGGALLTATRSSA